MNQVQLQPARYPRVTVLDVLDLAGLPWAMPGSAVGALTVRLAAVIGMNADQARRHLGLAGRRRNPHAQQQGSVAIIPVVGPILPTHSGLAQFLGLPTPGGIAYQLRQALADSSVSAVLLDFDSEGGVIAGVPELAAEIHKARGRKPIVASVNHAADGTAYWLAAACSEIAAGPSGMLGGIGIVAAHEDISGALAKQGVKPTLIARPAGKVDGNPYEPLSQSARAYLQRRVNEWYGMFVSDVARGRGVPESKVRTSYGEGRTLGAREALRLGMVDRLATFDDTLARLQARKPGSSPAAVGMSAEILASDLDFRRRRARMLAVELDDPRERRLQAEVERARIPAHVAAAAARALAYCRRDLGLAPMVLRWFDARAGADRYTLGMFSPAIADELWLAADQGPQEAAETVAHECRHAWQYANLSGFKVSDSAEARAWREHDARQYTQHVQPRLR